MKGYTLILTHAGADLDAISSQFAASKLYPGSYVINPGSLDINALKIVSIFGEVLRLTKVRELPYHIRRNVSRFIIVDTNDFERIGEGKSLLEANKHAEVVIFDHHLGETNIKNAKILHKKLGANTTLVVDLLRKKRIVLSPFEATLIAFGIFEDTGSFSFPSTTQEDFAAMSYLFSFGVDMKIIHHYLSPFLGEEQINLLRSLLQHYEEYKIKGSRVVVAFGEMESYVPGLSLIAHKLIELVDVDIVFVIFKMKKDIYIIGRSTSPDFNLIPVISRFGGGGHPTASSALVRDRSLDSIKNEIIDSLSLAYFPVLKAYHIMSSPVKVVHPSTTVREALTTMVKMGYSGLPVEENGKIIGMVSKRDLEKVMLFDRRNRSIKQFLSTQIVTVNLDSDLRDIEDEMIKKNVGRVLVEEKGEIKGIISRSDLLRAYRIKEELTALTAGAAPSFFTPDREYIKKVFKRSYPANVLNILRKFGQIADKAGVEIYMVGGAVRDLLLNKVNLDFDFVLSDAIKFGTLLQKEVKGKYRFYGDTKTLHVSIGGLDFDFATARREYYKENSLVPVVERASLKEDLGRRDFTINAIAINIHKSRFGEVVDFYGGYSDLARKKVRVLNNMSFIEDPSRILRAIKYMIKLQFSLSEDTEYLLKKAVELNVLRSKRSQRIIEELMELFEGEDALEAVKVMAKYGIVQNIFGQKQVTQRFLSRLANSKKLHEKYLPGEEYKYTLLFILLDEAKKEQAEVVLNYLSFRQSVIRNFIKSKEIIARFIREFNNKSKDELFFMLNEAEDYALVAALTKVHSRKRKTIEEFLTAGRNVKPQLTGKDLISMGFKEGPIFKRIFDELIRRKYLGELRSKEEEIRFVLENRSRFESKK